MEYYNGGIKYKMTTPSMQQIVYIPKHTPLTNLSPCPFLDKILYSNPDIDHNDNDEKQSM